MTLRGKKKLMLEALKAQLGVVSAACNQVGISRNTHYKWLRENEKYKEEVENLPEVTLDFVENALLKNIKSGNVTAQIFYLKTKGKERGYIERQEVYHKGKDLIINLVEKSVEEIKEGKKGNENP